MEVKSKKVQGDLIFMALDQIGDTSGGVTSQMISTKIREVAGVDVDNQYIEDFMLGISSRLISYINQMIMQGCTLMVARIMASVVVGNLVKKGAARAWKWIKRIATSLPTTGSKKTVFNKAMAMGSDETAVALREVDSTLKSMMIYNNVNNLVATSTDLSTIGTGTVMSARAYEGDSKIPGEGNLLKAVLEFKATAKQGF